ncbi:MAG: DMT family transporter [Clostridia bacterium]|nr:DMT family transporter [Clostridia bacterium]MBQ7101934.1 DMT family transporter [Clostridia bacterium]
MNLSSKKAFGGNIALLLAAFIWGTSFVAQSVGMESVEAFTFNGIRMFLGCAALLPLIVFMQIRKRKNDTRTEAEKKKQAAVQLKSGVICGVILYCASSFQQFAFNYSTPGKIGFITALYMLLVPVFGLALKQRPGLFVWFAVLMGCVGAYLLCVDAEMTIGKGELLTLACAVFYAIHILYIDSVVDKVDGVLLSFTQFFVVGVISAVCMLIFETPQAENIQAAMVPMLYSGIMSSGIAYTLQIIGQKHTQPAVASLLMCLESVFAVLSGWVILHEALTGREILGCVIMFVAIILTNLPERKKT